MIKATAFRAATGEPVEPFDTVWSRERSVATGGSVYRSATFLCVRLDGTEQGCLEVLTGRGIEYALPLDYGLYTRVEQASE